MYVHVLLILILLHLVFFPFQACAPWGNVCIVTGTHYIPIALPSILGTVFLLAPLLAVAAKLQQSSTEVTRKELRIQELEEEVKALKNINHGDEREKKK